ncbi:hypothetical protein IBX65_06275 [Candidatus Aerophobetes bacterium]|nr:hypothetical protein [Candidatus Aerophobetes bacterium]
MGFNFFAGLVLGAIVGFIIGYLAGAVSKPEEKKIPAREDKAKKLFELAIKEENGEKKTELLGKILEKYPHSQWADKVLEEVMKMKKETK